MSRNKKLYRELAQLISGLGFRCRRIEKTGNSHLCCHVEDDEGNRFKAFTGSTPSSDKSARLNFKQDVRRLSNRLKGLID